MTNIAIESFDMGVMLSACGVYLGATAVYMAIGTGKVRRCVPLGAAASVAIGSTASRPVPAPAKILLKEDLDIVVDMVIGPNAASFMADPAIIEVSESIRRIRHGEIFHGPRDRVQVIFSRNDRIF